VINNHLAGLALTAVRGLFIVPLHPEGFSERTKRRSPERLISSQQAKTAHSNAEEPSG
jgi:hypothetical protein